MYSHSVEKVLHNLGTDSVSHYLETHQTLSDVLTRTSYPMKGVCEGLSMKRIEPKAPSVFFYPDCPNGCGDTQAPFDTTAEMTHPPSLVNEMCGSRFNLPSTNQRSMFGPNGHVATCRDECMASQICKAITYE